MIGPQLLRFAVVGSVGFLVDAGAFTLLLHAGAGPYLSRLLSFLVAVGVTFALNRHYTFRGVARARMAIYLAVQGAGMALNMLVFTAVIAHPVWIPLQYYAGLVAGSLAALTLNFHLSRHYVFLHDE